MPYRRIIGISLNALTIGFCLSTVSIGYGIYTAGYFLAVFLIIGLFMGFFTFSKKELIVFHFYSIAAGIVVAAWEVGHMAHAWSQRPRADMTMLQYINQYVHFRFVVAGLFFYLILNLSGYFLIKLLKKVFNRIFSR